jgi:probable phosphoglycerate mutase
MTRLLALRHAATAWNELGRLQGRSDQPLSAAGRAAAAGWRLPRFAADWPVATSPLARARETAAAMGLAATPQPALIEMDWGRWEGRTLEEIAVTEGPALAANEARGLDFQPPGGESPRQVVARLRPWLAGLGGDQVAIAHKGVLRALLAFATGWPLLGKPPVRLAAGRALLFTLDAGGRPSLVLPTLSLTEAAA